MEQRAWDLGYPQGLYLQQLAFNMTSPAFQESPLQQQGFQGLPSAVMISSLQLHALPQQ